SIYRKKPLRKSLFTFGLLFGFGFYLSGISWIVNSLTFDDNFKVLIPFALVLIPLFLSLFIALPILFIGPHLNFSFSSICIFSGILAFSDFLRAKILTGFPWNLWAYSTVWLNEITQIINLIGLYSYNLILITIFTLPAIIFFKISATKKILYLTLITSAILGLFIFGNYEINKNKKRLDKINEKVFVKIISPNFDLRYGLTEEEIEERFKKLIRYSNPTKEKKTLFIWPEGVFSGYSYEEISIFKELIAKNFSRNHTIIFGTNRLDLKSGNFYNSMLAVDNNFKIIQSYNKRKLVPFGEFLPYENFLNKFGLKKITEGHGSFLKGDQNNNLIIDKANILPLICYEIIFTDLIQRSNLGTNIIINISEDGWFGKSIGPSQHFAKSIYRAIESDTFFLRSANKGVSAIIDNKGKIVKRLNKNEAGNIEFEVPLIQSNKIKNDLIFFVLLITYLLIFLINKNKNAK
ncbi:apolipoprotein N-acyltransferase, partial [Candidatus Pelagibacter bacterium]|nr:apolipoprotein N-acyltransferase [Candidatus Pelagibacter bacterium]MDC3157232.1 apolipoprotein N-acyltransferase [Candidatus Pelagibacter bacterium]